jgi:hypothetical protein
MRIGDIAGASVLTGARLPSHALAVTMDGVAGVFLWIRDRIWEVHFAADPKVRGAEAKSSFQHILAWFWHTQPCDELIGAIRRANAAARHMAVDLGFIRFSCHELLWPDGIVRETVVYKGYRP